jgi:hypothetical protein
LKNEAKEDKQKKAAYSNAYSRNSDRSIAVCGACEKLYGAKERR